MKRWILIVLIILAVFLIGGGITLFYFPKEEPVKQKTIYTKEDGCLLVKKEYSKESVSCEVVSNEEKELLLLAAVKDGVYLQVYQYDLKTGSLVLLPASSSPTG